MLLEAWYDPMSPVDEWGCTRCSKSSKSAVPLSTWLHYYILSCSRINPLHNLSQADKSPYCHLSLHVQIRALESAGVCIAESPADMGVLMRRAMEDAGKL